MGGKRGLLCFHTQRHRIQQVRRDIFRQKYRKINPHEQPLPDSCVKTLIRGALKKGAPEDLSCMCIVPSWHSRGLDAFLEKMSEKGQQHEEVDDGLDMFAS